jgi:NAD+ synthase
VRHDVVPIVPGVEALATMLPDLSGLAAENVQARLRMVTLMGLSNAHGHMLLTTGNKSEMSVGYATLYGDMAGGYSVLKDAYKTTVFALSRWRNAVRPEDALGPDGPVMPQRVIDKPPSAELRPDQKDEDSLPPYSLLDRILHALIEKEQSVAETARTTGADESLVADIEKKLLRAEYKRRQSPRALSWARATSVATAATPSPTLFTRDPNDSHPHRRHPAPRRRLRPPGSARPDARQ